MRIENLDTLGQIYARGGGLNEIYGPLRCFKYIWFGQYSADPSTTDWGSSFAGRLWFNTASSIFKFWDGSAVQSIGSGGGSPHDILSSTHTDTLAAAVTRGALIYGNATPKWAKLTVGAANKVLVADGTDVAWNDVPSHNQAATTITSGTLDGDRLPAISTTKRAGVPAAPSPSGKFLKDNDTWDVAGGASGAWPVGSVFIAVVSTNPATLLGFGTWAAFATGKVLIGIDTGDADFDTVEETGGAKTKAISAHAGTAVGNHAFTQPAAHSNHVFTQPSGHSNHIFTQPSGHSNHVFTQPATHTVVATKQGASAGNVVTTGTHTGGAVDAHSAHSGGAVDAHSAHAGGAVDAHSAHTGGAVDAHSVTQPSAHTDLNVVQPYIVVYMWKRTA